MRESNDVNCQGDEWMIIISVAAWVHSSSPDALFICKTIAKILERKKKKSGKWLHCFGNSTVIWSFDYLSLKVIKSIIEKP